MMNVTLMKASEFIARVELEIKFAFQPVETRLLLSELYQDVNGKLPSKRLHLLNWFFDNYRFNQEAESWQKLEPVLH